MFQINVFFLNFAWLFAYRYQESGFMWHWFDNILSNKSNIMKYYLNPPPDDAIVDVDPLKMSDLSGVFYLWSFGIIISILVFLGEMIVFRLKHSRKKPQYKRKGVPRPKHMSISLKRLSEIA